MKRWGKQNPTRFDEKELKTNLGSGNFIFVGSSNDMFAADVPREWIQRTIDHCNKFDNNYLFQTKNPERLLEFELPKNSVVCTTIETNRVYPEIMQNSPNPNARAAAFSLIFLPIYVTIEPIMDFDLVEMLNIIKQCDPVQVNIGADSGNHKLPEPSKEKVLKLIDGLNRFTTIERKRNLSRILK
jgi:protein gp37